MDLSNKKAKKKAEEEFLIQRKKSLEEIITKFDLRTRIGKTRRLESDDCLDVEREFIGWLIRLLSYKIEIEVDGKTEEFRLEMKHTGSSKIKRRKR